MDFYRSMILPRLLHLAMKNKEFTRIRNRPIPLHLHVRRVCGDLPMTSDRMQQRHGTPKVEFSRGIRPPRSVDSATTRWIIVLPS